MSVNSLPEMRQLLAWLGPMPRSKAQINSLNESDCELVRLGAKRALAVTIDTLSDEMEVGLYRDPFTVGWMTGVVSLSDLSASGAKPVGVLVSNTWAGTSDSEKKEYAAGLRAILKKTGVAHLGGDSGQGKSQVHSAVAVGFVEGRTVTRVGTKPGDFVAYIGTLGLGPALGFKLLLGLRDSVLQEDDYRPLPKIREGAASREFASAMMDTSDGLLTTLYTLSKLNGVGFELDWSEGLISPKAAAFCREAGLPLTSLLFGEHGDYQLLVTVPERKWAAFKKKIPGAVRIGRAVKKAGTMTLQIPSGPKYSLPVTEVQNLSRTELVDILKAFETVVGFLRERGAP
ncbi:MAG: thiamine-phosphate kinase [Bdellovibrionia bacterium]